MEKIKALILSRNKITENIPLGQRWKYRARMRKAIFLSISLADILGVDYDAETIVDFCFLIPLVDIPQDITGRKVLPEDIDKCLAGRLEADYCTLLKRIHEKLNCPEFIDTLKSVAYYQNLSTEPPTKERLEFITLNKGGYTGLSFLYLLKQNPTVAEENAFFKLGELLQVSDDYQDRKKDALEGYNTLFTEGYWGAEQVKKTHVEAMAMLYQLYDYREVRKLDYSFRAYLFLSSGILLPTFSDVFV